ncbi:MAG: 16S rRNA (cytosine(1402)-N(4))-methyltransferase RsmH [Nocardioidaceae bacterium]
MTEARHVPVLLDRVVELVAPALRTPGSVMVDATLGLAGHAGAILARCPNAHLVGLDRDPLALAQARDRLGEVSDRVTLVHSVHDGIQTVLAGLGHPRVGAVLFDLGVSSMQLDLAERGFAYAQDAPLDMRMDPTTGPTAADILNTYSERDLARVLRIYGEEKFATRIAAAVVRERAVAPWEFSSRLVEVVREAVPAAARRQGGHPAKRTFQALRIEVNDELSALRSALPQAIRAVRVGGRVVVLAYHSLEDRIVKQAFAIGTTARAPEGLPLTADQLQPELRLLTRGAEKATPAETAQNRRAQSVRLRAVERLREAA